MPLILFLAWRILFRKRRRGGASPEGQVGERAWPGMDSEFYLLEQKMAEAGLGRATDEALNEWQTRLTTTVPQPEALVPIFKIHRRLRFDPLGISAEDRKALKNDVAKWIDTFDSQRRENSGDEASSRNRNVTPSHESKF